VNKAIPRFLIAGRLTRDYIVCPSGEPLLDVPGGNALYASIGLMLWESDPPPAIIARVGEDYPQEWLDEFSRRGLNVSGVRVLPEAVDLRSFTAIVDRSTRAIDEPVAHFARLGLPFPKALLGYRPPLVNIDSRTRLLPTSLRQTDFPPQFMDAGAIHFCPLDFLVHSLLPPIMRQAEFTSVTVDPSPGYMNPTFWENVPTILTGLTAFMPSEDEVRSLFQSRSDDLWEMAETLASYGCEIIVIKCGERGQLLYDATSHNRWEVPAYPARMVNPMGAGDAFCGGFLAGYRRTCDPLQAVLCGNVSASLVVEGHRATFALDVLPGLPQARLESLQQSIRKV
jgi:sugar/nucleoside kinase (ribokinase family)